MFFNFGKLDFEIQVEKLLEKGEIWGEIFVKFGVKIPKNELWGEKMEWTQNSHLQVIFEIPENLKIFWGELFVILDQVSEFFRF